MKRKKKAAAALFAACAFGFSSVVPTFAHESAGPNGWMHQGWQIAEESAIAAVSLQAPAPAVKEIAGPIVTIEKQGTTDAAPAQYLNSSAPEAEEVRQVFTVNDQSALQTGYETVETTETFETSAPADSIPDFDVQAELGYIDSLIAQAEQMAAAKQPEESGTDADAPAETETPAAYPAEPEARRTELAAQIAALENERTALMAEQESLNSQILETDLLPDETEAEPEETLQESDPIETAAFENDEPGEEQPAFTAEPASAVECAASALMTADPETEARKAEIEARLVQIDEQLASLQAELNLLSQFPEAILPPESDSLEEETLEAVQAPVQTERDKPVFTTAYEWKVYVRDLEAELKGENPDTAWISSELERCKEALKKFEIVKMHRLYNPYTGEHFYTASTPEKNRLVKIGWQYEDIGWLAPRYGSPVYRLYNPYSGDHHYTMSAKERDSISKIGWIYEGVGWCSFDPKDPNAMPLYRQFNPYEQVGTHNYSPSQKEHKSLISIGWRDEGYAWYGIYPYSRVTETVENRTVTRFYNPETLKPLSGEVSIYGDDFYFNPADDNIMSTGIVNIPVSGSSKTVIHDDKGIRLYGVVNWKGKTYVLDMSTGAMKKGYQILGQPYFGKRNIYYFDSEGAMVKGKTIQANGQSMTFRADGTKVLTAAEQIQLDCLAVYDAVGRNLWNCFQWISSNRYKELPIPLTPPAGRTEEENYALMALEQRTGNCYTYGAGFAALARHLGYTAKLVKGTVGTVYGRANHGWTEILVNGTWYICDGSFQNATPQYKCYMQPKSNPTFRYYY